MALDDEDAELIASWQASLDNFDRLIWPLFERRGFTKDMAYLYWTVNRLINTIEEVPSMLEKRDDDDDGERWKH